MNQFLPERDKLDQHELFCHGVSQIFSIYKKWNSKSQQVTSEDKKIILRTSYIKMNIKGVKKVDLEVIADKDKQEGTINITIYKKAGFLKDLFGKNKEKFNLKVSIGKFVTRNKRVNEKEFKKLADAIVRKIKQLAEKKV